MWPPLACSPAGPFGWRYDNDRAPRMLAAVAAHRSVHQVLHGPAALLSHDENAVRCRRDLRQHQTGIVRSSLSKLAFAELDAEPAPRVVPLQGAGGGDSQAGAALQAGGVLDRDGPVGFLGVDVGGAAGDQGLAGSGGLGDLLVDLDVALFLVEVEAVLRQALGDGQWFHSDRAPAMPSLTSCLIFSGDWASDLRATLRRCWRG